MNARSSLLTLVLMIATVTMWDLMAKHARAAGGFCPVGEALVDPGYSNVEAFSYGYGGPTFSSFSSYGTYGFAPTYFPRPLFASVTPYAYGGFYARPAVAFASAGYARPFFVPSRPSFAIASAGRVRNFDAVAFSGRISPAASASVTTERFGLFGRVRSRSTATAAASGGFGVASASAASGGRKRGGAAAASAGAGGATAAAAGGRKRGGAASASAGFGSSSAATIRR